MYPGLYTWYLSMSGLDHPMVGLTGNQKPDQVDGRPPIDLDPMEVKRPQRKVRDSGLTFTSTTSWKSYTKMNRL